MEQDIRWKSALGVALALVLLIGTVYRMECRRKREVRIACVGDSITYGSGLKEREKNCYPQVLGRLLGERFRVRNFGVRGRTAMWYSNNPYVKEKMNSWSLDFEPDVVVLMFGTNDSKGENWRGVTAFKEQYRRMIEEYQKLSPKPEIYLCTPATAYYVNEQTEGAMKYNINGDTVEKKIVPAVRELAEEMELKLIEINKVTKGHPEWFAKDGIHPDRNGAKAIAEEVFRVLSKERGKI